MENSPRTDNVSFGNENMLLSCKNALYPVCYVTFSVFLTVVCLIGDSLLKKLLPDSYHARAAIDSFVHSIVGGISWVLVLLVQREPSGLIRNFTVEVCLCLLLAGAIDVDHFILARSLHIKDAFHMPHRPPFHCTSALFLLCACLTSVSLIWHHEHLNRLSWIVLTAGFTHHLRDANRRGLWFAPFGSTSPLSQATYITCIICYPFVLCLLMHFIVVPKKQLPLYESFSQTV